MTEPLSSEVQTLLCRVARELQHVQRTQHWSSTRMELLNQIVALVPAAADHIARANQQADRIRQMREDAAILADHLSNRTRR